MNILKIIPTAQLATNIDFTGTTTVIIDVLRASTTIVSLLESGISRIFPVLTVEEALELKKTNTDMLLIGERKGIKPTGFDFGNSPVDILKQTHSYFQGKKAIFTTTNGTNALLNSKESNETLIATFRNLKSVANILKLKKHPLRIICAGTNGNFSIEDYYCAGLLARYLANYYEPEDDFSWLACNISNYDMNVFLNSKTCRHIRNLESLGFIEDILFALELNKSTVVPLYDPNSNSILKYNCA